MSGQLPWARHNHVSTITVDWLDEIWQIVLSTEESACTAVSYERLSAWTYA